MSLFTKVFGTYSDRQVKKIEATADKIEALGGKYAAMSDAELRAQTDVLRGRLAKGETTDDILPDAFAVVAEASERVLGMRPFRVQLIGGVVIHQGRIAEMKTGEGKTLVATLPAYLNALTGAGVHIVTVNDYLARYQSEWMGILYRFLGLSVGLIVNGLDSAARKKAYAADITYGTNNEMGFDYLRDNMVIYKERMVQRGHAFAIVDEVDSILIDEARTPLIISGPGDESDPLYEKADRFARTLKCFRIKEIDSKKDDAEMGADADYIVDEKARNAVLTTAGTRKAEAYFGLENLADAENSAYMHHINNAIRAHGVMQRDVDYVVKDGQVLIVDSFTGRIMLGRRYSNGLHQAIEAKEGVKIERENKTQATITFQNYFRLYKKLSGMTGTALTEENEFREIYALDVVEVPTNRPMIRIDHNALVYKSAEGKYRAIIEQIIACHEKGQPVLVGTVSIDKSELISKLLTKRGIKHNVLNAKFHDKEAEIIAQAGKLGAITISTNMAGRGTDIKLGPGVAELGGLHVIGSSRHDSRRIDRQLRGRCSRQGDPGSSKFYVSLEDNLMRLFGSDRIVKIFDRFGLEEGDELQHPWLTKSIETAQRRVEQQHFAIRKRTLDFDDVMNKQREIIYGLRKEALLSENPHDVLFGVIEQVIESQIQLIASKPEAGEKGGGFSKSALLAYLNATFPLSFKDEELTAGISEDGRLISADDLTLQIVDRIEEAYKERNADLPEEQVQYLERHTVLEAIDRLWQEHLYAMDGLRSSMSLRVYAQKDPLVEYKQEAYKIFKTLMDQIYHDVANNLFRVTMTRLATLEEILATLPQELIHQTFGQFDGGSITVSSPELGQGMLNLPPLPGMLPPEQGEPVAEESAPQSPVHRTAPKIGRNDDCPCGSGKKYKKCCGKE